MLGIHYVAVLVAAVAAFVASSVYYMAFGKGALRLALVLWVGFPFMILTGAVLWDNRPWKFAAIHSGDWLMKLVLMALILGIWHS